MTDENRTPKTRGVKVELTLTKREAVRVFMHGFKRYPDGVHRAEVERSAEFKVRSAIAKALFARDWGDA